MRYLPGVPAAAPAAGPESLPLLKDMCAMEYAIVDIETTGGNAANSRITEIAIRIHNGLEVTDRFDTLINPGRDIPPAIFALTGIDNDMVRDAPPFEDIASRVYAMLKDRVFVAHNVNFDYSFIRHQLEACGYNWTAPRLCTVRTARKIKPGLRSYSLGNLCENLEIPLHNRHRAGGDCDATALLFSKLLEWDTDNTIRDMLKKVSGDQRLPPNLPQEQYEKLPGKPGVYYFHDQKGKVIYVGKALNIKKRVGQHFSGHNIRPQRQHFLREIFSLSYEVCATELMALLLECIEIRRLWPAHNRALKRFEPRFGLFVYEDLEGYKRLAVGKLSRPHSCVTVVNREYEAAQLLKKLADQFSIDIRFCRFSTQAPARPAPAPAAAEKPLPPAEVHNTLVDRALEALEASRPTFAILDKGREIGEQSCIWMEKGNFYGMGYISDDSQLTELTEIRDSLQRSAGNHYMARLMLSYAERHPARVRNVEL